jgi:hypothetical protein
MAHKLTTVERIRGLRAAIAAPRTPPHLRQPLARQLRKLETGRPKRRQKSSRRRNHSAALDWLIL